MKTLLWIILLVALLMLGIYCYERFLGEEQQGSQPSTTSQSTAQTAPPADTVKESEEAPAPKPPPSKGTVSGIYSGSKSKIKTIYSTHDAAVEKAAKSQ